MAIDSYGRNVGDMSPGALFKALGSEVKGTSTSNSNDGKYDKIIELVGQIAKRDKSYSEDFQDVKRIADSVADFAMNFKKEKGSGGSGGSLRNTEVQFLQKISQATTNLWQASQKQNTLWFGLAKLSKRAQQQISDAIKNAGCCGSVTKNQNQAIASTTLDATRAARKAAREASKTATSGGGAGSIPPVGSSGDSGGGAAASAGRGAFALGAGKILLDQFRTIHKMMVDSLDLDPFTHIFTGALKGSNMFRENMRQIVHQQVGFGNENREIEQQFLNIEAAVRSTGVRADEFAKHYTNNISRGLELATQSDKQWAKHYSVEERADKLRNRQMSRVLSVTTSALSTATALGMNTDSVNDTFMDWHMHLTASATELADMGRSMMNIARDTGVTGKQLEKAMKSSDAIMKALKSAGSFSAAAGKNVLGLTASMEKYGVGDKGSQIMQALSSRKAFLEDAAPETRSMLSRIGFEGGEDLKNAIQGGSVLSSKTQSKKFGDAHESMLMKFTKQSAGDFERFGVEMPKSVEGIEKAIQQLHAKGGEASIFAGAFDQRMRKSFGGMGVGDNVQMNKAFQENAMTSGDRIQKITDDMGKMQKEGRTNTDKFRELQRKSLEATTNEQLSGFATVQKAMQDAGVQSWDTASAEFKKDVQKKLADEMGEGRAGKFQEGLTGGGEAKGLISKLEDRAKAQDQNLNKILQDKGTSTAEVLKKLQSGDADLMQEAQMSLDAAAQQIQRKEAKSQDPVTQIRDILTDWNTSLFGKLLRIGASVEGVAAKVLYVGGYIVTLLGEILIALGTLKLLKGIAGSLGEIPAIGNALGGVGGGVGARGLLMTLGKVAGVLMPLVGGIKGYIEADGAKRSKVEGIGFGALTGSAGTGSMLSSTVGLEKGGTGDKALGVAGAGLWGAAAGAAIGTLIAPGIGTAIGGVLGGIIGAVTELIKIFTEGTDFIQKYFIAPFERLIDAIGKILSGAWDIVSGIMTLDFSKAFGGVEKIFQGVFAILTNGIRTAADWFMGIIMELPSMLLDGLKWLVVKLPDMIFDGIIGGLKSLASNPIVGAIFEPFVTLFEALRDVWNQLKSVIEPAIDALRDAWKFVKDGVSSILEPLFSLGEGSSFIGKLFGYLKDVIKVLADIIGFVIKVALWPMITTIRVIAEVLGFVIRTVLWPFKKAVEYLGQALTWLKDNVWSPFVDGIQMLSDKISSFLSTVWKPFQDAIDWVMAKFESISKLFSNKESNDDASKRIETSGSSATSGIGRMLNGNIFGGGYEVGKSVLNSINPLNWFDEGTREIQNDGVAMLHTGEMIIPKDVWETIKASGNGAFGGGGGISETLSGVWNNIKSMFGDISGGIGMGLFDSDQINDASKAATGGMTETLNNAWDGIKSLFGDTSGGVGMGLFDSNQISDAANSAYDQKAADSIPTDISQSNEGLFSTDSNIKEAVASSIMDMISKLTISDLNKSASSAIESKQSEKMNSTIADLSESLNYGTDASDSGIDKFIKEVLYGSSNDSVSPSSMDYRDQMGDVNTLGLTRTGMETAVGTEKYGSQGAANSGLPSMDAIADYLITSQADKLDNMIDLLESIDRNTQGGTSSIFSDIVGKLSGGLPPVNRPGVKNIARDNTRGFWDMTFGDAAPGTVSNEGRGGSA